VLVGRVTVVEIRLLGPVEVWVAGRRWEIGPPQRRAVLAALAVDAGRPVAAETLIDRVWGEAPPVQVRSAVHANITLIRRVLAEVNAAGDGPPVGLVRRAGGYVLQVDAQRVDLHRFRSLAAAARDRQVPDDERAGLLREARELWRGPALADLVGDWPVRMRASWGLERLDAAVDWACAELRLGRHEQVIGPVRALVADYPLAEALVAVLMRALAGAGRMAEALDCYAAVRARLVEELGADPGAELQGLHQAVLRGELDSTASPIGTQPAAPVPAVPALLPLDVHGFTGREDELDRLDTMLAAVGEQSTAVVISAVSGTAGVGKTALAVHWAHRIAEKFGDGQLYVNLRGFDPTGSVMDPAEAIRGFLDAFGVPAQRIPAGLDAQAGLYRSLLAGKRVLVVLDNARDAEQVRALLPGAPGCLAVVTSRNQLPGLVAAQGAHPLALDLLSEAEARQLLARRLGHGRVAAEPDATEEIIAWCARLPLALAIVAARAATHPQFPLAVLADQLRDARGGLDAFTGDDPATDARAVFSWSYQRLSPDAARLFRLLGLHPGPDLAVPAAASLAGIAVAQVRPMLTELTRANLVTEPTPGRYAFHDLLRAYATELTHSLDTDTDRRAALHRILDHYLHTAYAGARLLNTYQDSLTPAPHQPGVTLVELSDVRQVLAWFTAEHLVLLAAVDLAAAKGFDTHTWQLAWILVDLLDRRGHWNSLVATQHAALAGARRSADRRGQAHAHLALGGAYLRLGHDDDAHTHYRHALDLFGELDDPTSQIHTHLSLGWALEGRGRHREALGHAQQALDVFHTAVQRVGQARDLTALGWCYALLGDHQQALATCQQALKSLRETGDRNSEAQTWICMAHAAHHLGYHAHAVDAYQHALDQFRNLGDRYGEAVTLIRLGDTHQAAGHPDPARAAWQHALGILDQLDHPDADQIRMKLKELNRHDQRPDD
jgi:DNA-binding SARP family transcriptional activator/tetratricopeptide (TPR) repeat protein